MNQKENNDCCLQLSYYKSKLSIVAICKQQYVTNVSLKTIHLFINVTYFAIFALF